MENSIFYGDCIDGLRLMYAHGMRAQMCVTSPPYYALRDYGHTGQIGLEQSPDAYISKMVGVFRAVRDVLADDGTLWINIGDTYGEDKSLIGIPWMLALALKADGWTLRQDIIWHKPNPMPESVKDRCTKAHEYLFLLSKSPRYYFNAEAIKEPALGVQSSTGVGWNKISADDPREVRGLGRGRAKRHGFKRSGSKGAAVIPGQSADVHREDREECDYDITKRNRRSVWAIPTRPYKGAHFAVFPPDLIRPCILAGSRLGDCVLDPFMGSGTTAQVAIEEGRQYAGCEINPGYKPQQEQRIAGARAQLAAATRQPDIFAGG